MCSSSGSMKGRQNFEIFPSKNKKILSLSQNPLILFYEEIKHLKIELEDLNKTTGVPWPALQYRSCLLQNPDSRCWVRIWRYLKIWVGDKNLSLFRRILSVSKFQAICLHWFIYVIREYKVKRSALGWAATVFLMRSTVN